MKNNTASKTPDKLLNRIKDEVAKEKIDGPWYMLYEHNDRYSMSKIMDEVCHRYAEEVNKVLQQTNSELIQSLYQYKDNASPLLLKITILEQEIERLKLSRQKSCEASYKQAIKEASTIVDKYRLIESPGTIAAKIDFIKSNIVIVD